MERPPAPQPPCPPATVLSLQPPSPICHPDRRGGTCSSLHQQPIPAGSAALPIVILRACDFLSMERSRPNRLVPRQLFSPCNHPLLFVIPPAPACRGSVPGFPISQLLPATAYVVLLKENHMQLIEASTLGRKSGARGRDLQFTSPVTNPSWKPRPPPLSSCLPGRAG